MDAMAGQLAKGGAAQPNTMANAPVSKTNKAKPGNPNAAPAAEPAAAPAPAAEPAAAPAATGEPAPVKKRGGRKAKPAAPSQAEIDADREAKMGNFSDSIIRTSNPLAEALAARVEQHKRKMFETALVSGNASIFKK
jgi:hypothetical protein